jgi:chorismate mutase
MTLCCRGIRGATTANENTAEAIISATRALLQQIIAANDLREEDVASAIFSVTPDLNGAFPALAARQLGWEDTALMCCQEIPVPGAPAYCIRVLIHWNTTRNPKEIQHVYTNGAADLRSDRAAPSSFEHH